MIDVHDRPRSSPPGSVAWRRPRPRPARAASAWDRAIADFAVAWHLSPPERFALRRALCVPTQRLDALVRELLAEAAGLALESGQADLAAWCYTACEQITSDASARPSWEELAIERSVLEAITPVAAGGLARESLVWWCVRVVPRLPAETPDDAHRRTAACALYLAVAAVQAFTAEDATSHARAALLAALGTVVARRSRAVLGAA
jgi:hypothetical protein